MNETRRVMASVKVNGADTQDESDWAERAGMKACSLSVKITNPLIPVYNWIWDRFYPSGTYEDISIEHPNYDKIFFGFCNFIANTAAIFYGGLDLINHKRVRVNVCYTIDVRDDNTWIINDMLYLEKW